MRRQMAAPPLGGEELYIILWRARRQIFSIAVFAWLVSGKLLGTGFFSVADVVFPAAFFSLIQLFNSRPVFSFQTAIGCTGVGAEHIHGVFKKLDTFCMLAGFFVIVCGIDPTLCAYF